MKNWCDKYEKAYAYIRHRAGIVDSMIKWHYAFDFRQETLFLAVYILDRYLSAKIFPTFNNKMLWVTCLFIACKFEEVKIVRLEHFLKYCEPDITRSAIFELENRVLEAIQWKLTLICPYDFLKRIFYINLTDLENCGLTRLTSLLPPRSVPLRGPLRGVHQLGEGARRVLPGR